MKHFLTSILLLLAAASGSAAAADLDDVLVYRVRDEGSIMHWLQIAPLPWNAAYIGDSQSYDPFKPFGLSELALRPRAGDKVGKMTWRKMHYNGSTEGPTMCNLFAYGGGFGYAYTVAVAYLYSPVERPDAWFSGSADDGLKVVLNGKKLWSNQIQRSPSYDSDRFAAPLQKGWNTLVMLVDQIGGGHLLCARFVVGDQPLTDLEISLDPPAAGARRHPAAAYNSAATAALMPADTLRAEGKLVEAAAAYAKALEQYPLADEAPRAAYRLVVKALRPGLVEVAPRLDASGCTGIGKTRASAAEGALGWELDFGDPERRIAQELVVASVSGAAAPAPFEAPSVIGQRLAAQLAPDGAIAIDVLVSTCRGPDPLPDAHAVIARALKSGYDALKRSQAQAMRAVWEGFDVAAEDPFLERRLRGAMFFLTAGYRDDVVWGGTPSSLSSKINWGNCVFWDTEFYMFPPLLLSQPQIARNMMLYRHGLLEGARANARGSGARGARFGWQSHRDGSGHAGPFEDEIHITADIAYCAWWYAQSTGDADFFHRFGREIVVEAARFFASRTTWNAAQARAEIHGVIPPDEHVWDHYAGRVNNSAMTNGYAAWTMAKGADVGDGLATPEERAEWRRLAKALWLPRDAARNLFSEYEGYRGHAVKQADVGHLFFPLLVSADREEIRRNVYYYADREKETGLYLLHSPSVYGAALSRAGDAAGVRRFLELSARNATGPFEVPRESNYGGGVCTTASGSLLTLALYGLLGIENQGDDLTAHPCLVEETGALSISGLSFRGRRYAVAAKPGAAADIRLI